MASISPSTMDSSLQAGWNFAHPSAGDEIVISGLSGCYPESDNVYTFADKLFNKIDLITADDRRWSIKHPEIPERIGKIDNIDKFDASFFGIHNKQAHCMDPMCRMLLEKTFEAIVDAGMNPEEMRGTRTGVFVGACFSESEKTWFYEKLQPHGYALTGCARAMYANRISYWMGVNGPSYTVDSACSSSMYALEYAYRSIREGHCDKAIVGGCNLCLHPYVSLQFARLGVLNPDGKCKCFDEDANGYTRSEAICVVLLQKAKDARRVYAQLVHSKANCDGYKEQGITYPSGHMQRVLLEDFYMECGVDPTDIHYMEAHGTGTKVGDPEEIKALESIFIKDRKTPLYIGSVKSNIGHTEPASGLCSVTKVIIGMETGYIPPNINFTKPRKEMQALQDGTMIVVTEKTKWEGGYVGVNSFGFGGANCHILLKSNEKKKINNGIPRDDLPRLVYLSGRTEESIDSIVKDVAARPLDAEYIRILQESFKYNIPGHLYRGYSLFSKKQILTGKISFYEDVPKPIWFIFSGLGSQWTGMGTAMMKIPIFSSTIDKCQKILATKGINIINVITSKDTKTFEDNVKITVGITAIQLALIDLLKVIQVKPDHMIGYSIGEIACAYADECLTLEQAILSSYYIGLASKDMRTEAELLRNLKKLIPSPKERSFTWLTATENIKLAKHCSAEYLVHSLSCSVTLKQSIPKDAVVIEVAPHGHLQGLLKQAFGEDVVTIALLQKDYQDNIQTFSSAIGELYLAGCNPRMEFMYPDIQFPVSRGTPMVSPLIKWDHSADWYVTKFETQEKIKSGERTVTVLLSDEEMEYVAGHVIDGRTLFPATGYLMLVWETVGMMQGQLFSDMPIVFEDVKFLRATNVPKEGRIYLMIMVQKVSGHFEVIEGGQAVVTGKVRVPDNVERETSQSPTLTVQKKEDFLPLSEKDIYKELRLRGYYYSGVFRGLHSCDTSATVGEISWKGNYVSFMDTMLQMQILQEDTRGLFVPTSIHKLVIDAYKHKKLITELKKDETIPVHVYKKIETIVSGGITIRGLRASAIARRKPLGEPVLETYKFVPNYNDQLTLEQSVRMLVQLAFENKQNIKVRTAELLDDSSVEDTPLLSTLVQSVLGDLPLIQADINILTTKSLEEMTGITISEKKLVTESNCLLVIATNVINRTQLLQTALNALVNGGFVIARESTDMDLTKIELKDVEIILQHKLPNEQIILLRKSSEINFQTSIDVTNTTDNLNWLPVLQNAVKTDPNTIVYSQGDELSGVIGLVNCIRKEPGTDGVRCVFIIDKDAPKFDVTNKFYSDQLKKGLAINVMKDGIWGTYRHLLLSKQNNVEVEHAYVNVTVRGDLSSLRWLQGNLHSDSPLKSNNLLVHVYYSALNFRDIMTATGRLAPEVVAKGRFEQECVQGLEFAGRLSNGRKVMGMVAQGGLSTMVAAEPEFLWDVPDSWSLEDAVTIPIVYGTVFYAIIMEGKIRAGQSILIHAGSGGVGQAAINVALYFGCTVFTTVGTQEKRDFIKATWPQIKDNRIGNSRDTSFEQMIMIETQGKGVDLVLNSLSEEKLQASIRCLAHGGKFLEIGKFDLANDNPMPLSLFQKEASFHGIMLDHLFTAPGNLKRNLSSGLNQCIKDGAIKPLTRCVFKVEEIEEAFRFMATGKHIGKVLIKMREEEPEKIAKPSKRLVSALPRHISTSNGSYIITGGLGGFGLELTDWLVLRGARHILLTSRKGITTGYQAIRIKTWRSYGVQIKISTADITTFDGCKSLIEEATKMAPLEGIFNLAVILKDALLDNQTIENFEISFGPKPVATKHLDELTRMLCPELKMFVIFSSVSCGRGNAGQTNYGMGNSIMERICEQRKKDGFPALAVEWGAIGEVGLVAEMQENHGELEIGGTLQQRISSCLSVLDLFLKQSDPIVSSMVVAEKRSTAGAGSNIIEAVVNILGIRDIKTVSFHSSLAELGMDSIMAVEIKQTLEREFEVFLTPQDIRSLTFARLQEIASEKETVKTDQQIQDHTEVPEMGMIMMMRTIGDEESSKEPIKILPNQASLGSSNKTILIPGIEGMGSVLEPLAKNLTSQAICLQLGFENTTQDLQGMAESLLERTLAQLDSTEKFTLVGYSYGSAITLELAALLEKQGRFGNIILIDGSPTMLKEMVQQKIIAETENQFQNNVLAVIINIYMTGEITTNIINAFAKCPTWNEKIDSIIENAPKNTVHTEQHQRNVCNTIYQRLKAMANYESTIGTLKSNIKLIKPKQHTVFFDSEDFGLSAFTNNPIDLVYVEGNHVTILDNPECAQEINNTFQENVIFKESIVNNPENIEMREMPTLA